MFLQEIFIVINRTVGIGITKINKMNNREDIWMDFIVSIILLIFLYLISAFISWDLAWPISTLAGRLWAAVCIVGVIKTAIES